MKPHICKVLFMAAIAVLFPRLVRAGETPTLDLGKGRTYSHLNGSGLTIVKGELIREGVRTSDAILDKTLNVTVAPGKSFTMSRTGVYGTSATGSIGVSPDGAVIQFYSLYAECTTVENAKAKLREIGTALGFDSKTFDSAIDSGDIAKRYYWTALNERILPYWAVEVKNPITPDFPFIITVVFTWDAAVLQKLAERAYDFRDRFK